MFPFGAALGASPARDPRDPAAASPQESGHHGERPRTRTGPTSAGMGQTSPSAPNQKVVGLGLDKTLRLKVSRRPCRGSSRPRFLYIQRAANGFRRRQFRARAATPRAVCYAQPRRRTGCKATHQWAYIQADSTRTRRPKRTRERARTLPAPMRPEIFPP